MEMSLSMETPSGRPLALVLRISRLAGVAPVSSSPSGLYISRPLALYSYFIVTAINFIVLAGFALDLLTEPERSLRVRTPTSSLVWVANLSIVMLITCVATYRAPARVMCMIDCLYQIKKIKLLIASENNYQNTSERFKILMIISSCIYLWLLILFDIYGYLMDVLINNGEARTLLLYSFFFYEYFLELLVQLQFIFMALHIQSHLQLLNVALKQLIVTVKTDRKSGRNLFSIGDDLKNVCKTNSKTNILKDIPIPNQVSNIDIKSLSGHSVEVGRKQAFCTDENTVRELCNAYGGVCDVLRHMDDGHGLLLLLIVGSFFLQLIITPYYLVTSLYTSTARTGKIFLQIGWCIYHLVSMIMVVEPCYQTQKEMAKTQVLVLYLMRHVNRTDPMFVDLDIFSRLLRDDRPTYTPLGMFTLSRQLIVTIIGAVTTYLVIIFQFNTYDSNKRNNS